MVLNLGFSMSLVIAVSLFALGLIVAFSLDGKRSKKKKGTASVAAPVVRVSASDELRALVEKGGNGRVLMEGGFRLKENFATPDGFVVRGPLVLEDESNLDGPVEVFGNATLGVRARSSRPLFVHGDLTLGRDASVPCCRVEGNVFFHPGSRVDGALECNAVYLIDAPVEAPKLAEPQVADTAEQASS